MRKVCLFLFALAALGRGYALDSTDSTLIREAVDGYVRAWNYHKGVGFGDSFSEDADFVNIFGMSFSGREEIEKRHIEILETFLKDSTFEVTDLKLREVNPEVAIALVYWRVDGFRRPGMDSKETIYGVFTHTFVKNEKNWEITACQNTLIQ